MEDSVLVSIRQKLGPSGEYDVFDPQLIDYINMAFSRLHQLGIGTKEPFAITGSSERWSDFIPTGDLEAIRTYVYLKVRLLFDPPESSFVLQEYRRAIEELEWEMNTAVEWELYN